MSGYLYYPGCSMGASAVAYAESLAAISGPLGVELDEIDDWSCCGASEYMGIGQLRAFALIARNLALAERQRDGSRTVVAPCSLCYVNLAKTDHYLRLDPRLDRRVNAALEAGGMHYTPGAVEVRHLFEVIVDDVGLDEVRRHVVRPLTGLKVAPYLGCLVTRPDPDGRWASHERPREFDRLLAALGADVVDFPLRTECCGGHMAQIGPDTAFAMIGRLLDGAERAGADLLATVCPMCQLNVDFYQGEVNRHLHTHHHLPILFFTQLVALAFGEPPKRAGIGSEVVSARAALAKIGVEVPAEEPAEEGVEPSAGPPRRPRREKARGLPMPRMPVDAEDEVGR